ncbi:MAG: YbaY family lipoprotein [Candidatus Cybelea sp.]
MRASVVAVALPALVIATIAGVTAADTDLGSISGTVAYRERIALPPDATVTVTIQDIHTDVPVTLAETTFVPNRQVPIPFLLSYSKNAVVPSHDYVVRATISMDGRPRFASNFAYPVITKGRPDRVTMLLVGVAVQSDGDMSLGSHAWKLASFEGHDLAGIPNNRLPYVQFDMEKHALSGYSGCNRIFGSFTVQGSQLHLSPLGMTMMACTETALPEHTFMTGIQTVSSYVIENGKLKLLHDGTLVATFTQTSSPGH